MGDSTRASMSPGSSEKAFVVLALLLSTGAFTNLVIAPQNLQDEIGGMPLMQVIWSVVYLVTLCLLFWRCEKPLHVVFSEWPLVLLCALAMASIIWSEAPALTFRRAMALTLTLLFGVYFASRFSVKEQLHLLAKTFGICILLSFPFGLFHWGTSVDAGRGVVGWYGVFTQKNALGYMMVLSALIFLFLGRVNPERKGLAMFGFAASLLLTALSRSMTAIVTVAMLAVLLPYVTWMARKSARWMVTGMAFLLTVGTVLLYYVATHIVGLTGFLDRDPTLTGRVPLWILSVVMALRRPWLGYGFNAFWLPGDLYVQRIWQVLRWEPPHAHNGLLELWLEIGLLGAGIFILVFGHYLAKALRFLRRDHGPVSIWPLLFLLFMFFANLTEPFFLARNSIYFILYVALAINIGKRPSVHPAVATQKRYA